MCWGRDEKTLIRCMTASTTALSSVPSEVRLADREIHLWYATLGDFSRARPRLESTLSQDERRGASQFRAFDDHHLFTPQDLRRINAEAQEFMAEVIVTTEKDAARVNAEGFELPLAALRVEIEIVRNEELLEERLLAVVRDIPRAAAPIVGT